MPTTTHARGFLDYKNNNNNKIIVIIHFYMKCRAINNQPRCFMKTEMSRFTRGWLEKSKCNDNNYKNIMANIRLLGKII